MATNSEQKPRRQHRRGSGEGTIYQRKDGLWVGALMVGFRLDGRIDRRKVSAKTRGEVQAKLDALKSRAAGGTLLDAEKERATIKGFLERWLEAIKPTVRLSTWERYDSIMRLHVIPALGAKKLRALRPDDLQRFYGAKLTEPLRLRPGQKAEKAKTVANLSPMTIRKFHATIHRALSHAVKWGYLTRNVADAAQPPSVALSEMSPPNGADLAKLLDMAISGAECYRGALERGDSPDRAAQGHGDRLAALWAVAVYSGLRQGELLGLKWEDVDLDTGALTVRRILSRVRGAAGTEPIFGEPKTKKSRRTVAVPAEAAQTLRMHRVQQSLERLAAGPAWAGYDLVFSTHLGTPLHARNVLRDFKKALARADLPETFRFHDLRHAHATLMLRAGVPMKIASERLGHSAISITMDLYTHAIQAMDREAADLVQQALGR